MPYKNPEDDRAFRLRYRATKLAYMRRRYAENKEQILEGQREGYARNRVKRIADTKEYAKANPHVNRKAKAKYRAKKRLDPNYSAIEAARMQAWRKANPESYLATARRCYQNRKSNPSFIIECRLRARLTKLLRISKAPKYDTTFALVGCSIEFLRGYLQGMFKDGMQWNNIHIDHIRPLASFDLTDPDQQRQAFHFSNLQPLFAADNIRKGARL